MVQNIQQDLSSPTRVVTDKTMPDAPVKDGEKREEAIRKIRKLINPVTHSFEGQGRRLAF